MGQNALKRDAKENYQQRPYLDLFPAITPYSTGFLDVSPSHSLYWEQSGNPDGVPVLLLHGGPGAGATPTHRRFFDPEHYRIIIFDQRGAGRSQPLGDIKHNTLAYILEDMEKLRLRLQIDSWHVFGGSWGSTLAMKYAQKHPERCKSMILRGIFTLSQEEVDWFLYGIKNIFPEAWEQFVSFIPETERNDILRAYVQRLNSEDKTMAEQAGIRWALYESACSNLLPNFATITTQEQKDQALAISRIEAHYFLNQVIDEADAIIHHIDKIRHIPAIIIQGRYDVICPIITANHLHQHWPEADYIVVQEGGHSALDPAIRSRLIEATQTMRTIK
jgi:proline iminopeptidase